MRVYLVALGCKLNQSEIESWSRQLAARGCEIVSDPAHAELCIVNTCTVTHEAARKSRQIARRCRRSNAQAALVLTGCYVDISPKQASELPGAALLIGTADKDHLVDDVLGTLRIGRTRTAVFPKIASLHTRALVKIQDGCDNLCTYCVVRIARGKHRSRPVQDILDEIIAREADGYQEIVLTGVHIGSYGREHGTALSRLVRTILERTRFPRLRLSSIEPWDLTPELIALWQNPRLCRHLHLPLQSGCNATLRRMNRRYTAAEFVELVSPARHAIADLAVTTDVIVGFPAETEEEFSESAALISSLGFARIHVFPFSPRPGTVAADMPNQVSSAVARQRVARLHLIARQSSATYRRRFLGTTMDVLWEKARGDIWRGLTDNYIRVEVRTSAAIWNRIVPAKLLDLTDTGVRAELARDPVL